jgi:N6-L-threonylcarbamoyladenine synthase
MKSLTRWEKLGETRDDAVGEAFDKVARMLNLPFPGGPEIEKLAKKGDPQAIKFPRPMINSKDYDFSFSGLKTSVLYFLRGQDIPRANIAGGRLKINERAAQRDRTRDEWKQGGEERASELNFDARRPMNERGILPNICASFQKAAVDVLVSKTTRAARAYKAKSIFLSGGVAANKLLRKELSVISRQLSVNFFAPLMKYNTDNAAMIGVAAYISFLRKKNRAIRAQANLNL